MTTAADDLPIPAQLARDVVAQVPGALSRLAVYLVCLDGELAGRKVPVAAVAVAHGISRSAGFALAKLARSRTAGGLLVDSPWTGKAGRHGIVGEARGLPVDAAWTPRELHPPCSDYPRTAGPVQEGIVGPPRGLPVDSLIDPVCRDPDPDLHTQDRSAASAGPLLEVLLRRYSAAGVPPAMRWRVDLDSDMRWWREEVEPDPTWEGVNLASALGRWDRWLAKQYPLKLKGEKSTFPLNWRASLLKTLGFAKTGTETASSPPRRGAFAGQAQPVDVPVVAPVADPLAGWRTTR